MTTTESQNKVTFSLAVPVDWCSLGGSLSYSSPVIVFSDRGHPCFWNFNSAIPVDIVRVKSYVNCLFYPACVPVRITINKLNLIPKRVVSGQMFTHFVGNIWRSPLSW